MSNNHLSSSEFATLCQSQIKLLSQSLGAVWSVVYLTEKIDEVGTSAQLFPFAIYPIAQNQSFFQLPAIKLADIWQVMQSQSIGQLLPDNLTDKNTANSAKANCSRESTETKRLILPLFHQETFIGLLITGRDRDWQPRELEQIEEITRTIAIARFIELQYQWTRNELKVQENLRRIEHDRLDNLLHQLRNPLTALRTFGKLFLKRLLPDDPNTKLAQSILAQSDRFQALLEQFEAESNKLPSLDSSVSREQNSLPSDSDELIDRSSFLLPGSVTELAPVDLKQILEPLLNTASAIAADRNITLVDRLPVAIPLVIGDASALREIFNNLLDNALKYTSSGGKVRLSFKTAPRTIGIAIEDTGSGIPQSDRERIFERHYRGVQEQGDIPGTGLGLAIARELIVKMRGEIEIISPNDFATDSPGTTFIVWLPVTEP